MKAKSLLWCDLTPENVESLHNATTRPEREKYEYYKYLFKY